MEIRSIAHRGLKKLFLDDDSRGLPAASVGKLRAMLTLLQDMGEIDELKAYPSWKAHCLSGNRKGSWSLTVTRNWRLTFRVADGEIHDLNFEDYH